MIRLLAAILIGISAFAAGGCRAPMWVGGDPYEPQITRSAVQEMADTLSLPEAEREALLELHAAYLDEHSRAAAKLREYVQTIAALQGDEEQQPSHDRLAQKRLTAFVRYADHVNRLSDAFLSDARLTLTNEQSSRWPEAERLLRRRQFLSSDGGRGGVDLERLVEQLKLSPESSAALAPLLQQYLLAIDAPLSREAVFLRTNLRRNLEAAEAQNDQAHRDLFREWLTLEREERAINRRFARMIEAQLPEARKADFRAGVQRAMHQPFRVATDVDEAVKKLAAIEPLPPASAAEVSRVLADRERRLRELMGDVAAKIDQWEEKSTIDDQMENRGAPLERDSVYQEIARIDRRAIRELSAVLTSQQMEALGLTRLPRDLPDLEFEAPGHSP